MQTPTWHLCGRTVEGKCQPRQSGSVQLQEKQVHLSGGGIAAAVEMGTKPYTARMISLTGIDRQRQSNAFARWRDALILRLLDQHPATAGLLVAIGLFSTRKKASKRLARLRERKQIRCIGTVALKDGRPEYVYARGRHQWKADNLVHEVQLTQVCLKIHADNIQREPEKIDSYLRPDAELWIAGRHYLLELDRGTESIADVVGTRFEKYQLTRDCVLWICPSERRLENLREQAAVLCLNVLFTTIDRALSNPHAAIWIDLAGNRVALSLGDEGGDEGEVIPGDNGGSKGVPLSPPGCGTPTTPLHTDRGSSSPETVNETPSHQATPLDGR